MAQPLEIINSYTYFTRKLFLSYNEISTEINGHNTIYKCSTFYIKWITINIQMDWIDVDLYGFRKLRWCFINYQQFLVYTSCIIETFRQSIFGIVQPVNYTGILVSFFSISIICWWWVKKKCHYHKVIYIFQSKVTRKKERA